MDYITRLDNFDAPDIANIAVGSELYEEAFAIYNKYNQHVEAVTVLLSNLAHLDRAFEYAEKVDQSEVWTKLGKAQLDHVLVKEAIGVCFLSHFASDLNLFSYFKSLNDRLIPPRRRRHGLCGSHCCCGTGQQVRGSCEVFADG